ncbi:MAG TPA: hemerythrin domain-containing protein [Actinomycetota bacterium]
MSQPWASFLQAHAALRGRIASACRATADSAATDDPSLHRELVELHGLLAHGLLRHMDVEDRVLYPALARAEGQMSVDLLAIDHRAIAGLEREVALAEGALSNGDLAPEDRRRLVRTLHGLEMLVDLHMTKEEEICLPALDRELEAAIRQDLDDSLDTMERAELLAE